MVPGKHFVSTNRKSCNSMFVRGTQYTDRAHVEPLSTVGRDPTPAGRNTWFGSNAKQFAHSLESVGRLFTYSRSLEVSGVRRKWLGSGWFLVKT